MVQRFAQFVIRWRLPIIVFWLVVAAAIFIFAPSLADVADYSSQGFLPRDVASKQAERILNNITGTRNGQSILVVTMTNPAGLSAEDDSIGRELVKNLSVGGSVKTIQSVLDPWQGPDYRKQLVDVTGKTALIVLGINDTAYAHSNPKTVADIRAFMAKSHDAKPSLSFHLTGEAAFSTDEHSLVRDGMAMITIVTVIVVLVVLVFIFRSPFTPLLPLSVIGLSFLISRGIVAILSLAGFRVSAYTETFLIAVLFGAGTDYALLLISRFREEMNAGKSKTEALSVAQRWSTVAIVSSAAATIVGFLCMGLAVFGLFNSTGPSVAIGVTIAMLMVLTLTPAIMSLVGDKIFWPGKIRPAVASAKPQLWQRLADFIGRKPGLVLLLTLAVFLPSVIASGFMQRSFDQVTEVPPYADSRQGYEQISRDFGQGELMPIKLTIKTDKDIWGLKALPVLDAVAESLGSLKGASRIRNATRPTGIRVDRLIADQDKSKPAEAIPAKFVLPKIVIAAHPDLKTAMETFIADDGHSSYFDVILNAPPYTTGSINLIETIKQRAQETLKDSWLSEATLEVGGPTAMFADLKRVTASDFSLVTTVVLVGILLVLVLLLRSLVAPAYLLLTILLSFLSTMGLCQFVFQFILGYEGVNWAVQFFSFCILVALGVDYNIFLMSRLKEEYRPGETRQAVKRALVGTGKIITSCGLIMAGCFCAMMLSPMRSIQEVGFATVTGLLIDTFIIRSLMVPSIAVIIGEANWWPWGRKMPPLPATKPKA